MRSRDERNVRGGPSDDLPLSGPRILTRGRYAVLRHEMPATNRPSSATDRGDHFDWMFEAADALLTWATDELPEESGNHDQPRRIAAVMLPPHRKIYLDYEGPVSGNRGTVSRVEHGRFELVAAGPDGYELQLSGSRRGRLGIYRTCSQHSSSSWEIGFCP